MIRKDISDCSSASQIAEKEKMFEIEETNQFKEKIKRDKFYESINEQNIFLKEQLENQNKLLNQKSIELKSSRRINILMMVIACLSLIATIIFGVIGNIK